MSDIVSVPSKEGIGHRPADLVQLIPSGLIQEVNVAPEVENIIFDSTKEAGVPDFTALVEKGEKERQDRLGVVRKLLEEIKEKRVVEYARNLNTIYYSGQAKAFGFWIPLDLSRVNGVAYPVPEEPRREKFKTNEEFEAARGEFADALSSQEKHALSGVPFN